MDEVQGAKEGHDIRKYIDQIRGIRSYAIESQRCQQKVRPMTFLDWTMLES